MKITTLSLLFLVGIIQFSLGQASDCQSLKNSLRQSRSVNYFYQANALDYERVNVFFAECNWTIDPAVDSIFGNVKYLFAALDNTDSITFDLSSKLIVDSVVSQNSSCIFLHDSDLLRIYFPSLILSSSTDSLIIYYHGKPEATGNGSFTRGDHSGVPVIWTLSEPYGASDWWPCRQNTADKIDSMLINCKIPSGNKCASNGKLVSVEQVGNENIYHWKTNYPIAPYLVAISVTNYDELKDTLVLSNNDTLAILNYFYPENYSSWQNSTSTTKQLLEFYDSLLINYPFSKEKYGNAQFGWGGGMEHQTMSFVGEFSFELIAHEMAHQWFGDYTTCESWEDIWLHEGFATYMTGMCVERFQPENWYAWKVNSLEDIISKPNGTVSCDDTSSLSRIFSGRLSYRKASFLLHMLRWKYGDLLFQNALKNYLETPNLAYSYSRTIDLKNSFQVVTGENQDAFFNEWFYGEGFPSYTVEWENDKNVVDLTIKQSTSDASILFFHNPLPIEFKNNSSDTIVVVDPQFSGEHFHFILNFTPLYVNIDPEIQIISGGNKVIRKLPVGSITDELSIIPNPALDFLQVKSTNSSLNLNAFSLFTLLGEKIFTVSIGEKNRIDLTDKNLDSGLYIADISTSSGHYFQKIIIEK